MRKVALSTLLDLLHQRATENPDQEAYTFLQDDVTVSGSLSYQYLLQQSQAIAAQLQQLGSPGQRVLLLYPPGLDFISGFCGCLAAGMIAVPAYPPRPNQSLNRLQSILRDAEATFALTTRALWPKKAHWQDQDSNFAQLKWLDTSSIPNIYQKDWQPPKINQDTLALLQYTSGSTGNPKGVMVSHDNLLVNCRDLAQGWNQDRESKIVSWLPTFHDLGLVYGILTPLLVGCACYLMSPISFLLKPLNWLKIISRYQATHSAAPNFGYDLCVRKFKPEQGKELDLKNWKMALNGAQPVRAETIERFSQTFAPYGFKRQAFSPGYGLAEATLKVAAVRQPDAPMFLEIESAALSENRAVIAENRYLKSQTLVGCGDSEIDTKIQIINPKSLTPCKPMEIGEIWVSGTTVAQGYWNNPEATAETFQAYLRDTGEGPFIRTGDLGFLYKGQLFVTGRLKDLIIIEGRNHYPQDIELTVENNHPALRSGCSAAFSVLVKGEERLVVVQEVERSYGCNLELATVKQKIREAVAVEHDLRLYQIALIRHGTISKTSSGKIQRQKCRQQFLNNQLNLLTSSRKSSEKKLQDANIRTA